MRPTVRPAPFTIAGVTVAYISDVDTAALQALMERCQDHFDVHEGRTTPSNAAHEMMQTTPPNYDRTRILHLGLYGEDGRMVGCLSTPPDYPQHGDWYIGLLLLDPAVRNQGLGARTINAFEAWVAANGGTRILISVADENHLGRRFWDRLGFVPLRTIEPRERGSKIQGMTEMVRPVNAQALRMSILPAE